MAKGLREWVTKRVRRIRRKSLTWLSEEHFFRLRAVQLRKPEDPVANFSAVQQKAYVTLDLPTY